MKMIFRFLYILTFMLLMTACGCSKKDIPLQARRDNIDVPFDTAVNDFVLDDTISFLKMLRGRNMVVQQIPHYGEATVFCNAEGTEYFVARINYGGYKGQYDAFWVMDSSVFRNDVAALRLPVRNFLSSRGARIGADASFLESYTSGMNKQILGDTLVYFFSEPSYPYYCEYIFVRNNLIRYSFNYLDP